MSWWLIIPVYPGGFTLARQHFFKMVKQHPEILCLFKKPSFWLCIFVLMSGLVAVLGCATPPPENKEDICAIFEEKRGWYKHAKQASERWGSPISVMMAIIHHESGFDGSAQPPRKRILWIFPGSRPSTAYGYSQALDSTWDAYRQDSGNQGADRDDFEDAIDFVGWYNNRSHKECGIEANDTYSLYLAYHEGQAGFNRRTFKNKARLKKVAQNVSKRSAVYRGQLQRCQKSLEESSWWPF